MNVDVLSRQLIRIPHLDLNLVYDADAMKREADVSFIAWETSITNAAVANQYRENWSGRSLMGYSASSTEDVSEISAERIAENRGRSMVETDLAQACPSIMSAVRHFRTRSRARLLCIRGGGSLVWHSHTNAMIKNLTQTTVEQVVQVPIRVPDGCLWSVTTKSNLDFTRSPIGAVLDPSLVYSQQYAEGRAVCFNSFHFHNVFNRSPTPRVTLMFYVDLNDPVVYRIFDDALQAYRGPLIED